MRPVFIAFLLITAVSVQAEIYIWTDENGVKHFSDRRPTGLDSSQITGDVKTRQVNSEALNIMQPVEIPPSSNLGKRSSTVNVKNSADGGSNNKRRRKTEADGQKDSGEIGSREDVLNARNNAAKTYNETASDEDKLPDGYNKQARIRQIEAEKAQNKDDYRNRNAKDEQGNAKRSKPKKLSAKLKSHNARKKSDSASN